MDKITIANECQHMEIVNKQYHIISKEFLIYFENQTEGNPSFDLDVCKLVTS